MQADPVFVHEVDLGRIPWALWVSVGTLSAMSAMLWYFVSLPINLAGPHPLLIVGAGLFQTFLVAMAGLALADGRLRAGTYRVVLSEAELRVAYPPVLFGRSDGGSFTVALARIQRLVIDRYTGHEPSYSVQCDDGTQQYLELPRGDDDEVWPRLFVAIRQFRPAVVLEDWTHTLKGRVPTDAEPGAAPNPAT